MPQLGEHQPARLMDRLSDLLPPLDLFIGMDPWRKHIADTLCAHLGAFADD